MASFFDLRKIDNMTKLIINSYTRGHGKESNVRIPMEIQYVIVHFYWIAEKFALHGDWIKLNEESNIATMSGRNNVYNTVYGDSVIHLDDENVTVYKWTFKILHGAARYEQPITIGIDSSADSELLYGDFADNDINQDKFYAVTVTGWKCSWSGGEKSIEEMDYLADGDILVIIFNVDKRKIWCKAKNKIHCIAENVIVKDVKYKMAVSMSRKDDSVQLLSFEEKMY